MKFIFMLLLPLLIGCTWQRYYLENTKVSVMLPKAPKNTGYQCEIFEVEYNKIKYVIEVYDIPNRCFSFICDNYHDALERIILELVYDIAKSGDSEFIEIKQVNNDAYEAIEIYFLRRKKSNTEYYRSRTLIHDKKVYAFIMSRKDGIMIPDTIASTFFDSILFVENP
jgi:hypothetical protein